MAPEQARGETLDIRADLYALGATLYHAVTGRTPFSGSSAAVMNSHLRHDLPPPESINPNLSAGCIAIIKTLMAKDRHHRYATPETAKQDVERVLNGEAPVANPPNTSPLPRPPRTPRTPDQGPPTTAKAPEEQRKPDRSSSRRGHRRRMRWSLIMFWAGIVWLIGIILMIWLIRELRSSPKPASEQPLKSPTDQAY
jgi:serine/threonine protein kinase